MGHISSIDDLLAGVGNSQQPMTPEHKDKIVEEETEKEPVETPDYDDGSEQEESEPVETDEPSDDRPETESKSDHPDEEFDEYGNEKERISPGMKERLDRKEKQHQREMEQREQEIQTLRQQLANQGASREVQKAAADFKYDPNDEASWQQQLTDFVKHTVSNMQREETEKTRQIQEESVQREFHTKFTQGMKRFDDFRDVVSRQPIDDAMTLALRGMADPSAFIYAASKRQPEELKRISELKDPYARMVEMGKLEERMRRTKSSTKAPRPLGRTREDSVQKVQPKQKEKTGDDLLANADAKRIATVKSRLKGNR